MRAVVVGGLLIALLHSCADGASDPLAPEQAAEKYYLAWQNKDSLTLKTLLPAQDTTRLAGRYYALFNKNPVVEFRNVAKLNVLMDSLAFIDVVGSVSGGPAADTAQLILQRSDGWKVVIDASHWRRIDRF